MAVRIVDALQAVEIGKNNERAALGALGLLQMLVGQRHEAAAVVQTCQLVEDGQFLQSFLLELTLGDIARDDNQLPRDIPSRPRHLANRAFEPDVAAVFAADTISE